MSGVPTVGQLVPDPVASAPTIASSTLYPTSFSPLNSTPNGATAFSVVVPGDNTPSSPLPIIYNTQLVLPVASSTVPPMYSLAPQQQPTDGLVVVGAGAHVVCSRQQTLRSGGIDSAHETTSLVQLWDRDLDLSIMQQQMPVPVILDIGTDAMTASSSFVDPNTYPLHSANTGSQSSSGGAWRKPRVFAAADCSVVALDAMTGAVEWMTSITGLHELIGIHWSITGYNSAICDAGDSVAATSDCIVARIDKSTGAPLWRTPLPLAPMGPYNQPPVMPCLAPGIQPSLVWSGVWGTVFAINMDHGCVVSRVVLNRAPMANMGIAQSEDWPMSVFAGVLGFVHFLDVTPLGLVKSKEVNLEGSGYHGVSVACHNSRLYCGTNGSVFCLSVPERKVLWENNLQGCGYQGTSLPIAVISEGGPRSALYAVTVAISSRIVAIGPNGATMWVCQLPNKSKDRVSVLWDACHRCLYAGYRGDVYLVNWHNGSIVANTSLARGYICSIATATAYTDHLQGTTLQEMSTMDMSWVEQQNRTFTCWVNHHLGKRGLSMPNLNALCDGVLLPNLVEILSGRSLRYNKNPRMRVHKIENLSICLACIKECGGRVLVGTEDLLDGNLKLILGLIWVLITLFQVKMDKAKLLELVSARVPAVSDFTAACWGDGTAICSLVRAFSPTSISDDPNMTTPITRATAAIQAAETHLHVPRIIAPEDLLASDSLCLITYLSFFFH
ncbi:gelation factor [Pelomyxa schiedti]|nr:gelation factor [Pelomyxa schiedti]